MTQAWDDDDLASYESFDALGQGMTMAPEYADTPAPEEPVYSPRLAGPAGPTSYAQPTPVSFAPPPPDAPLPGIAGPAGIGGQTGPVGRIYDPTAPLPAAPNPPAGDWRVRAHQEFGVVPPPGMSQAEFADRVRARGGNPVNYTGPEPLPPGTQPAASPVARGGVGGGHLGAGAGIASALPPELQPDIGGQYYDRDYSTRVATWLAARDAARAVGTAGVPGAAIAADAAAQADRQLAAKALAGQEAWGRTPTGMAVRGAQLQDEATQIQAGAEQDRLAREIALGEEARKLAAEQTQRDRVATEMAAKRQAAEQAAFGDWQKRVKAADAEIDAIQVGDDRNIGERVLDAIAAALGELGAGLTGGPNRALDVIQKNIDRRIDAQKSRKATAEKKAGQTRNDWGAYQQNFDREEDAQRALEARYWREHADALQYQASIAGTDIARIKQQELADLAKNKADQLDNSIRQGITEQMLQPRGGGGAAQAAPGQRGNTRPGTVQMTRDQEFADRYSPAIGGYVAPWAQKEAATGTIAWNNVQKLASKAKAIIDADRNSKLPWQATQKKLDALIPGTLQSISGALGGGVITDNDIMREALQNPGDLFTSPEGAAAQLETWTGVAESGKADVARTYGVQYGEAPQYVGEDEKGKPKYNVTLYPSSAEIEAQQRAQAARGAGRAVEEPEQGSDVAIALQRDLAEWEAANEPAKPRKRGKKGEE